MAKRVEGKVAIVTGAGAGIGRANCLRLAEEGAKVVVTDISEERGDEVAHEAKSRGGEGGVFLRHDVVTREDGWGASVVRETNERYGGVDALMDNAGVYPIKPLADTTVEEWNNLMAVNVTGASLGMKHRAPVTARRGAGSIIDPSSPSRGSRA